MYNQSPLGLGYVDMKIISNSELGMSKWIFLYKIFMYAYCIRLNYMKYFGIGIQFILCCLKYFCVILLNINDCYESAIDVLILE